MNVYDWVYCSLIKQAEHRPRVETVVTDGRGHVLVGRDKRNWLSDAPVFPGGGVDPQDARKLSRAAQREIREEAGYDVRAMRPIRMKPHVTPWSQSKQEHFLYRKGLRYEGEKTHFFQAKAHRRDMKDYGADRDQLKGLQFLPKATVVKALQKSMREAQDDQERNEYLGRLNALSALRGK